MNKDRSDDVYANSRNPIAYHDSIAETWDDRYLRGSFARRAALFDSKIMPLIKGGGRWLDVGCGSGLFTRKVAAKSESVIGLDASEAMISMAKSLVVQDELQNVEFRIGDACRLEFQEAQFDGCLCLSVLEYLPDCRSCMIEMSRVLKPGGTMILSIPHRYSPVRTLQRGIVNMAGAVAPKSWTYMKLSSNAMAPHDIPQVLASCGLQLRQVIGFDPLVPIQLQWMWPPSLLFVVAARNGNPSARSTLS